MQGGQALRTGTDNLPVLGMPMGQTAGASIAPSAPTDYGNMQVPSVWRTGRPQAAARVDALASNGMDEIEIPAFLRRQAD